MGFLGPIFQFLANLVGFGSKRQDLKNTEEMKNNAEARDEANETRKIEQATDKQDLEAERDNLAE